MRTRTHIARLIALTLVGGLALSACGIRGNLQTPPPLWGDKSEPQQQSDDQQDADTENADTENFDKQGADKRVSNT